MFLHVPPGPHRWGCSLHSTISTTVKLILSKGYISSITDTLETALSVSTCSSRATQMGLFFTLIYIYNSKVNTESILYPLSQTHWKLPWVFWATQMVLFFTLIYIYNSKVNTESILYPLLQTHWKLSWVFLHVPPGPHRLGCSFHSSISTTAKLILSQSYILYYRHTGNCPECFYRFLLGHTDGAVLYTHLYLQQQS